MKTYITLNIILYTFYILCIIGYIKCIVKLCQCDFEAPYKAECIYGIGAVTGLGCVVGWMNISDTLPQKNK